MKLWHCTGARSSRVLWCLHEMNLEEKIELVTMPFPPRVFYRDYLQHNVLGTIPYFEDFGDDGKGTVKMTESVGICFYLAQKYNSSLMVQPYEKDYGQFINWLFHSDATLTFPQTVVLRYTLQEPGVADAAVSGYAKWYIARLRMLNNVLADGREFLCENRLTIADICITYPLFMGRGLKSDGKYLSEFYKPQTRKYMERMLSRKGWLDAKNMENESFKQFTAKQELLRMKL